MSDKYHGPPMDLANMRQNGVRSLSVGCLDCHHQAIVNVDSYPGHLAVPSFARRMKCSSSKQGSTSLAEPAIRKHDGFRAR
jgi:hypothetical protein